MTLYGLAAGKYPGGMLPGLVAVPFGFYLLGKLNEKRGQAPQPIEIPELAELLIECGARKPHLSILRGKDNREYPRPFIYGEAISISEVALESLSRPALNWFLRTEYRSQKRVFGFFGRTFPGLALVTLPLMGLIERFKVSDWWMLGILAMLVIYFALGFKVEALEQLRADRETTISDEDFLAAKEALSYPFFAQIHRRRGKRFMFNPKELERRAKNLGIELEEGYRVPGAMPIRLGESEVGVASQA